MSGSSALTLKKDRNDHIVQLSIYGDVLTIRIGCGTTSCFVVKLNDTPDYLREFSNHIEGNLRKFGYSECNAPEGLTDGSIGNLVWTNKIPDDPSFTSVSNDITRVYGSERPWLILHFAEGLSFDDNFDFGTFGRACGAAGLIIEGPVTTQGILFSTGDDGPVCVRVNGDVTARSLINTNTLMQIDGTLSVMQTVLGKSSDGELYIHGAVSAEALIGDDQVISAERYDCHRFCRDRSPDISWLDPDVAVLYDGIPDFPDGDKIWDRILNGRSVLSAPDAS